MNQGSRALLVSTPIPRGLLRELEEAHLELLEARRDAAAKRLRRLHEDGLGLLVVDEGGAVRRRALPGLFNPEITTRGAVGVIFQVTYQPFFSIRLSQNIFKFLLFSTNQTDFKQLSLEFPATLAKPP